MIAVGASNPLRNEALEYIQSEIARVGVGKLDRGGIVKAFVARGASRARVYGWIKEETDAHLNPPPPEPDPLEVEVAQAEAKVRAAERAKVLDALPSKAEMVDLEREAAAAARVHRQTPESRVPGSPSPPPVTIDSSGVEQPASGIGAVMGKLERAIDTVEHCITYSYGENGRVRNPRMALASADTLRKCLETALKLHETVDNVQAVQRFMAEIMAELRDVAPDVAAAVVERLRVVTARWAK